MADQGDQGGDQGDLIACKYCGRKFNQESHDKHEPHCPDNIHREKFDSGKQRAEGSDITYDAVEKAEKEREEAGGHFKPPETGWREADSELQQELSQAEGKDRND